MQNSLTNQNPKPPLRWVTLTVLGIPVLASLTLVPWYGLTHGYDLYEWAWFLALLTFCELSITAGYHRLWSHSAYKAHPALRFIFALGGACALQNDCLTWASDHRRHHLHVDDNEKDPYSANKGFWYAHFEWMIRDYEATREDLTNAKDLLKDPILVWQRKHYLVLMLLMNIGLPVLLGWLHGDIWGSLMLAGFLRLFLSQHFTYLINSAAHFWGNKTYDPKQTARDNWFIALFTFGEGYHNYHRLGLPQRHQVVSLRPDQVADQDLLLAETRQQPAYLFTLSHRTDAHRGPIHHDRQPPRTAPGARTQFEGAPGIRISTAGAIPA
jgi:stearoyl-CoA desaturase (delta-9 desaturase)